MDALLAELRKKVTIGFVGGSDFAKISGQLTAGETNGACLVPACTLTLSTNQHARLTRRIIQCWTSTTLDSLRTV